MRRDNPETNLPFIYGDTRPDGYVFWGYETKQVKKNGYFVERWYDAETFEAKRAKSNAHKRAHRTTKHGCMVKLIHAARHSAKKRGHDAPTIDAEFLTALWDSQQGLCAYTNWPMNFETGDDRLVSLERKNNSIGYVPDNVVLVCWCVNNARNDMARDQFFAMCKAIAANCE